MRGVIDNNGTEQETVRNNKNGAGASDLYASALCRVYGKEQAGRNESDFLRT